MTTAELFAEPALSLDFVSREKIHNESIGFTEPSGLSLSAENGELWAISDDTSAVFKFRPNNLMNIIAMPIDEKEMEAIALAESEGYFFTVNEEKGRIACFSMSDGERLRRKKISSMVGYDDIRSNVEAVDSASGFEGITWHPKHGSVFVVLEGPPGLLLEISADLSTILSSLPLTEALGFVDPDNAKATIDFSGLSYDATRDRLWVLSDEAARVFLFDLKTKQVTQSLALNRISNKGKQKAVKKPEGISLSPDGTRLYVVSDSGARLYQWSIR